MLFFQLMLLGGYCYADILARMRSTKRQVIIHLSLLLVAIVLLPIIPSDEWRVAGLGNPTWRILLLLFVTVGGPYFLISSSAPLLQIWFARMRPGAEPYRLYAFSNVGSMLALLSYPFVFERFLPLRTQAWVWSGGYLILAVLMSLCVWRLLIGAGETNDESTDSPEADASNDVPPPMWGRYLLWLALPMVGSALLVATMNRMTQDVPAIPLLFVVPLSVYLLTFVIAFDSPRWYWRPLFCVALPLAIGGAMYETKINVDLGVFARVGLLLGALFFCCMSCHGEVYRLRPAPRYLTRFYLMVALGGALGSVSVAILSPIVFDWYWEFEIALAAALLLVVGVIGCELWRRSSNSWLRGATQVAVATVAIGSVAAVLYVGSECVTWLDEDVVFIERCRNFYGVATVVRTADEGDGDYEADDSWDVIRLRHGHILHGEQYTAPDKREWTTTYYGPESGVGLALANHPSRGTEDRVFRIGVVGLGAGTLAAFANQPDLGEFHGLDLNDSVRFYDINPEVERLARKHFTYIADAGERGAEVDVVIGDARLVLEEEVRRGDEPGFDVLAIDAFSGDTIPMHLLTKECFDIYLKRLAEGGALAIHVTNRYLNLAPVVRTMSEDVGWPVFLIEALDDDYGHYLNWWVVISKNDALMDALTFMDSRLAFENEDAKTIRWTDEFSSVLDALDRPLFGEDEDVDEDNWDEK